MLKKTITYTDFDGETQTDDFYFNLTKAELAELMLTAPEQDLRTHLRRIMRKKDGQEVIDSFKKIVRMSYGERQGNAFVKTEDVWNQFFFSPAYSELFMELVTDAKKGAAFVEGIIPGDLADEMPEDLMVEAGNDPDVTPEFSKEWDDYSKEQLLTMPDEQFFAIVGSEDPTKMTKQQLKIAFQRKNNKRA